MVFKSLFFSIGPTIDLMKSAGIPTFALDGTHSKNHLGGTILFLVAYDSNGQIRIVAFMFCDGETSENYKLFAERCKVAGVGIILGGDPEASNRSPPSCRTDRAAAMNAFFDVFPELTRLYCVWHLIRNARAHCQTKKSRGTFHDNDMWLIAGSCSKEDYNTNLGKLRAKAPVAATYMKNVDVDKWVLYAIKATHNVDTNGYRTNGAAESVNGRFVSARAFTPMKMAEVILIRESRTFALMSKAHEAPNLDHVLLTKWADRKVEQEYSLSQAYKAERIDGDHCAYVYLASDHMKRREVNLKADPPCKCGFAQNHSLPCRHVIAWLVGSKQFTTIEALVNARVPSCFHLSTFLDAYKGLALYPVFSESLQAPAEGAILVVPPEEKKKRGRPRTQRFENNGSGGKDGGVRPPPHSLTPGPSLTPAPIPDPNYNVDARIPRLNKGKNSKYD